MFKCQCYFCNSYKISFPFNKFKPGNNIWSCYRTKEHFNFGNKFVEKEINRSQTISACSPMCNQYQTLLKYDISYTRTNL